MGGGPRPAGAARNRAIRNAMAHRQQVERQKKPKPQGAGQTDHTKKVVQNAFDEYKELMRQTSEQNKKIMEQVKNGIYEGAQSESERDLMDKFYGRDPY